MTTGKKTGGWKKGTLNKMAASKIAEIEASCLMSLDCMLTIMRDEAMTSENVSRTRYARTT